MKGSVPEPAAAAATVVVVVGPTLAGLTGVGDVVVVVDGNAVPCAARATKGGAEEGVQANDAVSVRPSDAVRSMFDVIVTDFSVKITGVESSFGCHVLFGRFTIAVSGWA